MELIQGSPHPKNRIRSLTAKKNKILKKQNKKQLNFENYEVTRGISLKIINTNVEKAKADIHGNYVYKVDNDSHYEIDCEIDYTGSSDIKARDAVEDNLIFRETRAFWFKK